MTKIFKTIFDNWLFARRFVEVILLLAIITLFFYDGLAWLILYNPFNLMAIKDVLAWILVVVLIDYHYQGV